MLLLYVAASLRGQDMTTMGTDFWFTYLRSVEVIPQLNVYVSAPRACSVTLTNSHTGWTTTESVVPGVVTSIEMQRIDSYTYYNEYGVDAWKGVHLVATDTVSVYISLQAPFSFDETIVLPTAVLRDKYVIQNYPADTYGSEFAVLATEDSTWVDIYLTDSTLMGGYAPGDTLHVFLDSAGKTYYQRSVNIGDFSGTRVEARDCKPIAVFHGNDCVYVPDNPTGHTCDHVIEQAVPTDYWGKAFVVVSCGSVAFADRVRVTALDDSCVIVRNGNVLATINAFETFEYRLVTNMWYQGADYLTTSTPASVNVYFSSTNDGQGDPSMVTVPPLDQAVKKITFNSSSTAATQTHFVNVVMRTQDYPYLRLDGNTLNQSFEMIQSNHDYLFGRVELQEGSHTLRMVGGAGFSAYAFGLGTHESYAYSIGSGMRDLSNRMVVGGYTVNPMSNLLFCKGDTIPIYIETSIQHAPNQWFVNDSAVSVCDTLRTLFDREGVYNIMVVMTQQEESCFAMVDTLWATVRVANPDTIEFVQGTCEPVYVWEGESFDEGGTYVHRYTNRNGCDSILILHLDMHADGRYFIPMEACDSAVINNQVYYTDDTITLGVYQDRWGCDSVVLAVLKINNSSHSVHDVYIMEGDSLVWIDGMEYRDETEEPFWTLHSADGCDSVIHLHLHLVQGAQPPPIDSSTLWVPNVFTPEESNNNYFSIYCNDLLEAQVYIFTRQGELIVRFNGLTERWDGRHNGKMCKMEPYVYHIEYITKSRPDYKQYKTGTVLLLR